MLGQKVNYTNYAFRPLYEKQGKLKESPEASAKGKFYPNESAYIFFNQYSQ
jgi:hypothetical protein